MDKSQVILIDFHGTLTNGVLNIGHDGTMFESVCVRDIRAIRELIAYGYEVYIVTQSSSKIIDAYCKKVGCEKYVVRDKSQIEFENYIAIGDDVPDVPMLRKAVVAYAPKNCHQSVRDVPGIKICNNKGGDGIIDELLPYLINPLKQIA